MYTIYICVYCNTVTHNMITEIHPQEETRGDQKMKDDCDTSLCEYKTAVLGS